MARTPELLSLMVRSAAKRASNPMRDCAAVDLILRVDAVASPQDEDRQ